MEREEEIMQNLSGTYIWHYVSNEDKIAGPVAHTQYLVCYEQPTESGSVWYMQLTRWYCKDDEVTVMDSLGKPHYFKVEKDGFHISNGLSDGKGPIFVRLNGVRYWTEIELPNVDPDDILSIV